VYHKCLAEKGIDSEETLNAFFFLYDASNLLNRVKEISSYLEQVVPVCRKRGGRLKFKALQAQAFVHWKTGRFHEALSLFLEIEALAGKGAAICENIAHTYDAIGQYDKAEEYFSQSLIFLQAAKDQPCLADRAGICMGLGLVRDRLGKHQEALPLVQKAYESYKERAKGEPSTLQANAGMAAAKINVVLGNFPKAEEYLNEAVRFFTALCGSDSKQACRARVELGKVLWTMRKRFDAQEALMGAYRIEALQNPLDLAPILEIHGLLMDTHLKDTDQVDRTRFQEYFATSDVVLARVQKELDQDIHAAVYYKLAAELRTWGGQYEDGEHFFKIALSLLEKETAVDCSLLIDSCTDMLALCQRNVAGTQQSPMSFNVPTSKAEAEGLLEVNAPQNPLALEDDVFEDADDGTCGINEDYQLVEGQLVSRSPAGLQLTVLDAADHADMVLLRSTVAPIFSTEMQLSRHVAKGGRGYRFCFVARGLLAQEVLGVAICGSDGVHGHLLQVLIKAGLCEDTKWTIRKALVKRSVEASAALGLQSFKAEAVDIQEERLFLERTGGWNAVPRNFSCTFPLGLSGKAR